MAVCEGRHLRQLTSVLSTCCPPPTAKTSLLPGMETSCRSKRGYNRSARRVVVPVLLSTAHTSARSAPLVPLVPAHAPKVSASAYLYCWFVGSMQCIRIQRTCL